METEPIWELVPDTSGRVALVSSRRWWKTLFPVLLSGFVRFRESRRTGSSAGQGWSAQRPGDHCYGQYCWQNNAFV